MLFNLKFSNLKKLLALGLGSALALSSVNTAFAFGFSTDYNQFPSEIKINKVNSVCVADNPYTYFNRKKVEFIAFQGFPNYVYTEERGKNLFNLVFREYKKPVNIKGIYFNNMNLYYIEKVVDGENKYLMRSLRNENFSFYASFNTSCK